jgi:hypothetical protein
LADRMQTEKPWLNDKLAVPGLSIVSPLNKLKGVKPFRLAPPAKFKR